LVKVFRERIAADPEASIMAAGRRGKRFPAEKEVPV
jgi:hypothetical protein